MGNELLTKYDEYRLFLAWHVFFSHFRPRDYTQENCFSQMSSHARASTYICMHNLWQEKRHIPWRTVRGLNWESKTYKLKRSIQDNYFQNTAYLHSVQISRYWWEIQILIKYNNVVSFYFSCSKPYIFFSKCTGPLTAMVWTLNDEWQNFSFGSLVRKNILRRVMLVKNTVYRTLFIIIGLYSILVFCKWLYTVI